MLHVLTNEFKVFDHFFPEDKFVESDLGCGKGGFTLQLAQQYPDRLVIGADVMLGRLRRILKKAERVELKNLLLFRASAVELVHYQIPDNAVDRVHILCPDPWPKTRHRSKRLLCSEFFGKLIKMVKPGGTIHLATDDAPYYEFIKDALEGISGIELAEELIADVIDIRTDFEKAWLLEGKEVPHLSYRVIK